jgi:hypothetical protein
MSMYTSVSNITLYLSKYDVFHLIKDFGKFRLQMCTPKLLPNPNERNKNVSLISFIQRYKNNREYWRENNTRYLQIMSYFHSFILSRHTILILVDILLNNLRLKHSIPVKLIGTLTCPPYFWQRTPNDLTTTEPWCIILDSASLYSKNRLLAGQGRVMEFNVTRRRMEENVSNRRLGLCVTTHRLEA